MGAEFTEEEVFTPEIVEGGYTKEIRSSESENAVTFYFHPNSYNLSEEETQEKINAMVTGGYCIGGSVKGLLGGVLTIYFNPLIQGRPVRDMAYEKINDFFKDHREDR